MHKNYNVAYFDEVTFNFIPIDLVNLSKYLY